MCGVGNPAPCVSQVLTTVLHSRAQCWGHGAVSLLLSCARPHGFRPSICCHSSWIVLLSGKIQFRTDFPGVVRPWGWEGKENSKAIVFPWWLNFFLFLATIFSSKHFPVWCPVSGIPSWHNSILVYLLVRGYLFSTQRFCRPCYYVQGW